MKRHRTGYTVSTRDSETWHRTPQGAEREAERKYYRIAGGLGDGIYKWDSDGNSTRVGVTRIEND